MEIFIWVYKLIGSSFCHQLPERTIDVGGVPLPLCARDTGIYIGVMLSSFYIFVRGRFKADKPPQLLPTIVLCLMMSPMIFDGITSYVGYRDTNNEIRIFTGMCFGVSLPFFLIPLVNYRIYGRNTVEVLVHIREVLAIAVVGISICAIILYTEVLPWFFISSTVIFGLIFVIARLIYTFVYRCKLFGTLTRRLLVFSITVVFLLIMYLISNNILRPLILILIKE